MSGTAALRRHLIGMSNRGIDQHLLNTLTAHLGTGTVSKHLPDSPERLVFWNDGEPGKPLAHVFCRDVDAVKTALQIARNSGTPVSVAGGRLDPYGRPKHDDCIVLDLSPMSRARYSPEEGTITVEGGAKTKDLLSGLPGDIATVTGTNADIGVAGITSGGGYGMLNSRYGLACDVLERAEIMLADGSFVPTSSTENEELFWAIRGGGTGFGVVTSMTFRTFRLSQVWAAIFKVPLPSAERGFLVMQELLDHEPELLSILPLAAVGPDGERVLTFWAVWNGEAGGEQMVLRAFNAITGTQVVQQGFTPYEKSLDPGTLWPWNQRWTFQTGLFSRIDEEVASMLAHAAREMPGPNSILFLQDFHGAPTRVSPDATAFSLRSNHYVWVASGHWSEGDDETADRQRAWTRKAFEAIQSKLLPGGYINFLHSSETRRSRQFFGASADRLIRIKQQVDPLDLFVAGTGRLS